MRNRRLFCLVLLAATALMLALAMGFPGTLAYYFTHARAPTEIPGTASAADILDVGGAFDEERWLATGKSGIVITNKANSRVWIYFTLDGSLRDALQHINPVALEPGEACELQMPLVDPTELGLLGWRNQHREFAGMITARVLNDYAAYTVAEMRISADRLFERLADDGGEADLSGITTVGDIAEVIIHRDRLIEENAALQEANGSLLERLRDILSSLSANPGAGQGNREQPGEPAGADGGAEEPGAEPDGGEPHPGEISQPSVPDTGQPAQDAGAGPPAAGEEEMTPIGPEQPAGGGGGDTGPFQEPAAGGGDSLGNGGNTEGN